jgi:hypothetical protein
VSTVQFCLWPPLLYLALQFANNSGSALGSIKHANQGVFLILGADASMNQTSDSNEEASVYGTVEIRVFLSSSPPPSRG